MTIIVFLLIFTMISCTTEPLYRPNTDPQPEELPKVEGWQELWLDGKGQGVYEVTEDGGVTINLNGRNSAYGVCSDVLCSGHFEAEAKADKNLNYGLAIVKEKDGRPDPDNFVAVSACREDNIIMIRAFDRQKGVLNVLDNTKKIKPQDKEFRYTVPLNNSYFSVPFNGADGRVKILRNNISGFFHLYIGVSKVINGKSYEDWIETAQIHDWNPSGTHFFVCPFARLQDDKRVELNFSDLRFAEFPSADVPGNSFKAERRSFTWAGFPGEAVVVSFDKRFCANSGKDRQFVFWTESNYVPFWHMDNELIYSYEFCETWSRNGKGCYEPMSDRLLAYSNVEILEDNPVRKVVKYHYALVNPDYEAPYLDGSYPEIDEYYTFYPDGIGVRKIHFIQNGQPDKRYHELAEPMVIAGSSTVPQDHFKEPGFVISNLSGGRYQLYPDKSSFDAANANVPKWNEQIYRARLKNSPDPFCVFPNTIYKNVSDLSPTIDLGWHGTGYEMSHFPVDKQKYLRVNYDDFSKSFSTWHSQVSHTSLIGVEAKQGTDWTSDFRLDSKGRKYRIYQMMLGIVEPDDENSINGFIGSWLSPCVGSAEGMTLATVQNYDKREITLDCRATSGVRSITFSPDSKIKNPVFLIREWKGKAPESLQLGETRLVAGTDFITHLESGNLLLWLNINLDKKVTLTFPE